MSTQAAIRNPSVAMARVVVVRSSDRDIRFRSLRVHVDGIVLADLLYGKRRSLELPSGTHTILVSNGLSKSSRTFDCSPGETVYVQVGHAFPLLHVLFLFLGAVSYRPFIYEIGREFEDG